MRRSARSGSPPSTRLQADNGVVGLWPCTLGTEPRVPRSRSTGSRQSHEEALRCCVAIERDLEESSPVTIPAIWHEPVNQIDGPLKARSLSLASRHMPPSLGAKTAHERTRAFDSPCQFDPWQSQQHARAVD